MLQRENRLPDLTPERGFVAAKPIENSVVEVGQMRISLMVSNDFTRW
jgi:hypothetical protein